IHGIPAFLENAKAYLCIAAVRADAAEREGALLNALKYLCAAKMCEKKLTLSQEQEDAKNADLQKRIQEQVAASKYNAYWGLSLEEYYSYVARKYKENSKDFSSWQIAPADLADVKALPRKLMQATMKIELKDMDALEGRMESLAKDIITEYYALLKQV